MRRIGRYLLRAVVSLLALALLLAGMVAVVLNTESGTRWALARVTAALPGELVAENFHGTLWGELYFPLLTYTDDVQVIELREFSFGIRWPALAARRVSLRSVSAATVSHRSLVPSPAPAPLSVSMPALPVDVVVSRVVVDELLLLGGEKDQLISRVAVERLRVSGKELSVVSVTAATDIVSVSISNLTTTVSGDVPLSANVGWTLADNSWSGQGTLHGSLLELMFEQRIDGPYLCNAEGSIKLLHRMEPELDLRVYWDRWVFGNSELLEGELHLWGLPDAYKASYAATAVVGDQETMHLSGTASGDSGAISDFSLGLVAALGQAELSGHIAWQPVFSAGAVVRATNIEPSAVHDKLTGQLGASAELAIDADGLVSVHEFLLSGVLNDRTMSLNGDLLLSSNVQTCLGCRLVIGENSIGVNGGLEQEDLSLSLSVNAPVLAALWPGLSGSASGNVDIDGSLAQPGIRTELMLRELAYADTSYGALKLSGQGDVGRMDINAEWSNRGAVLDATVRILLLDDGVQLTAAVDQVPLQVADSLLPKNLGLLGYASTDIDISRKAGQWSGRMDWRQADTVLRVSELSGAVTDVAIPRAEFHADLDDSGLTAYALLAVESGMLGELDFSLDRLATDATLQASLKLRGDDWHWVSAAIPQLDRFDGSVVAALTAAGPLNAPQFEGELEWRDGALTVPALNVPINDISVLISGASDGDATVSATARAGDGTLAINGRFLNVMQASRSLSLVVSGTAAELINWPEYRLWASPELELAGDVDGWRIGGQLTVPKAEIAIREVPVGAVTVSPDVVVLGEEENPASAIRVSGETTLLLGDGVHFSALGLDTRLSGKLLLKMADERPLRAEGQVSMLDGTFNARGQKLEIEQGELTFTGPVDDPLVDVKARRVIETLDGSVTAGIHLHGRASNLTTSVYSSPAMSEADALSYLVIGRPLSQAAASDGGELSGAAVALGLRQAARITDQIGQALGLDELSVAGTGGDTTALVAGKQINSRLYARYAYGVFSRLGTLLLRYRMSQRLTLEAGAGENQSIDILYSIEN